MKHARGAASDTDLTAEDLQELVAEFKQIFAENVDAAAYPSLVVDGAVQFPQDPSVQLQLAIEAVFGSWNNPRATLYRKQNKIATIWAPPSTCSPWCSATWVTTPAPAWPSLGIPLPASVSCTVSS